MNNNKYKEIYEHQIPIDLAREWGVIEKKLDKSKKRRPIIWFFRGFMFVMLLVPFGYLLLNESRINQSYNLLSKTAEIEENYNETTGAHENSVMNNLPESDIKLSLNKKEDLVAKTLGSPFIKQKQVFNKTLNTQIQDQPQSPGMNLNNQLNTQIIAFKGDDRPNNLNVNQTSTRDALEKVVAINSLSPKAFFNDAKYQLNQSVEVKTIEDLLKSKHSLTLNIMGGLGSRSTSIDNSNESYVALRQSSEKVLESYKLRLGYEYKLSKNWALSSGIDISSIVEHLQYRDVVVQNGNTSNQIIGTYTDQNGKVENLVGNQDFHRIYNVDISSYNSLNTVSIPLNIVYSRSKNNMVWSVSTGINQPVFTNYKGKLIDEDKLPYDVKTLNNFKVTNRLMLNHGIATDYSVSKNLRFSAGFLIEYDLGKRIQLNGISHSYVSLLGNLGLKYIL